MIRPPPWDPAVIGWGLSLWGACANCVG